MCGCPSPACRGPRRACARRSGLEQVKGIEPSLSAWKADVLTVIRRLQNTGVSACGRSIHGATLTGSAGPVPLGVHHMDVETVYLLSIRFPWYHLITTLYRFLSPVCRWSTCAACTHTGSCNSCLQKFAPISGPADTGAAVFHGPGHRSPVRWPPRSPAG